MILNDSQLLQYSRQIMLPEIDISGQQRLQNARVLIVGLGGLGSPVALYLAAAGVGSLVFIDDDDVELSNLQRQIAHNAERVGSNKAASAAQAISELNPSTHVTCISQRQDAVHLAARLADVDVVVDATDSFASRVVINQACWQARVPLVSAAAIRWEGQLTVFDPRDATSPCYQCLYSEANEGELNCSENGVIAPLVGILGTSQALEAIKLITGVGRPLVGKINYFDAKDNEWRTMRLAADPNCSNPFHSGI